MKIINISNRLPISLSKDEKGITIKNSSGGLVSAISSLKDASHELHWVGVADFSRVNWLTSKEMYSGDFHLHPVFLQDDLYKLYYNGFSNSVLWPLFHYFPSFVEYKKNEFDAYLEVNKHIAEQIQFLISKDDIVWIHDYHLIPLVAYLRELVPNAKIGFFLHITFPSYELIRILPKECRSILINSLLGADLIGFHTYDYVQHFLTTIQMIASLQHKNFLLHHEGRTIKVDAFPISVDFKKFNDAYSSPAVSKEREKIRTLYAGKKILFSVDRLDYTKGIKYRLKGYAHFLENNPEWKEKVVFILVAVPSRGNIIKYEERREIIEKLIAEINGKHGSYKWSPIIYQYGSVDFDQLNGLYTSCDAAFISPVRDGMNLVAKEFVASRHDKHGVLLLSDMTGAAKELTEALLFNPLDEAEIGVKIGQALDMKENEQQKRMERMQKQIASNDIFNWSSNFIASLQQQKQIIDIPLYMDRFIAAEIFDKYQQAEKCLLLLDYDGTLSELASHPDLAKPTQELYLLLNQLCQKESNEVVIISGRDKATLDRWFGSKNYTLIAEHGIFAKRNQWKKLITDFSPWKDKVRQIMERFSENCTNTFVEEKEYSLSWHYRNADPEISLPQSRELMNLLSDFLISSNANILDGKKVIEVKPVQANKGIAIRKMFNNFEHYSCCICIGDDKTDEDMFKEVNDSGGITIKVGLGHSLAKYRMESVSQVLTFLMQLSGKVRRNV